MSLTSWTVGQGGRRRKAVFIVQMCQVASTGSGGSDWNDSAGGDRKGHTALIQARFWPSAPARCFKEPPPLSVCWDRTQLSASLHQKDKTQFYTSEPKCHARAEPVRTVSPLYLDPYIPVILVEEIKLNWTSYFLHLVDAFVVVGLHMTNPCNSIWRVSCNLWRLFLWGCVKRDDGPQSSFCSFKVLEKKECWRREDSHPWRTTNSADSSWPRSTATFKRGEEIIITSFIENHTYKKLLSFTVMLFLFLSNPG